MASDGKAEIVNPKQEKHPWHSWPFELPSATELAEYDIYRKLQDENFHRITAQENRDRVFGKFPEAKGTAIVLKGGTARDFELYDQDVDKCEFRQESFFRWLFIINEPDAWGVLDLEKKETILFVDRVPDDAERWNGDRRPPEYYSKRYGMTETHWSSELDHQLKKRGITKLLVLKGTNRDSGNETRTTADFEGINSGYTVDNAQLFPTLSMLRAIKSANEIKMMRWGNIITSQAHVYVMRHIKPGMTELHCEMLFKAWCGYFGACRHMAYVCICGSGGHGAILHYGHAGRPNDRILQDGDRIVLDMGADYNGYATDVTRSYPVNGKFSADQVAIHNAVLHGETCTDWLNASFWSICSRLAFCTMAQWRISRRLRSVLCSCLTDWVTCWE